MKIAPNYIKLTLILIAVVIMGFFIYTIKTNTHYFELDQSTQNLIVVIIFALLGILFKVVATKSSK